MSLTRRGKNNPNYNPALTEEDRKRGRRYVPGYLNWIKDVYARDSFKCVLCGSSRKLNAHHLDSWADFPKKRLEIANGVTLCKHHHDEFHSQYGRKHARKPKFEEFASSYKDDK